MTNKHLHRSIIPTKSTANIKQDQKYISTNSYELNGWKLKGNDAHVIASIRLIQHDYQCFSDWSKQDMRSFWSFIGKLHRYDWKNLLDTGGKVNKTGLAPTIISKDRYPNTTFRNSMEDNIDMIELRVDNTKRVHGFRVGPIFYICWLDKNHAICA
ncbi:MAG6450 family protein [Chitinophaga rhizophila]|uniref:Uncharacterized protein n=1 Tax=Chitinophaga rhizophila TaxID=2866212 RepID=A0ABS7GDH7_9BACT|nr:hypothetical protein [Chitinophaga rhizophila]MBW8684553.1 hypothetical protein [Chitinophaga rhizophila]